MFGEFPDRLLHDTTMRGAKGVTLRRENLVSGEVVQAMLAQFRELNDSRVYQHPSGKTITGHPVLVLMGDCAVLYFVPFQS